MDTTSSHRLNIIVSNRFATTRRNIFCNMTTCAIYFNPDFLSSGTDLTTLSTFPLQQTGPQRLLATNQLIHFRGQYSHQQHAGATVLRIQKKEDFTQKFSTSSFYTLHSFIIQERHITGKENYS
jgi:hypothetical protein